MADALSIAGSIAGLISIGDIVARRMYHYVRTVRNAESEILALKNEITVLTGVLHNLHLVADDLEGSARNNSVRIEHVHGCLGTLYKLEKFLKHFNLPIKEIPAKNCTSLNGHSKSHKPKSFVKRSDDIEKL